MASVAVFNDYCQLLWSGEELAPHAASGACLRLLAICAEECAVEVSQGTLFAADLGPGSFTGVRVGIVLAKTFAFLNQSPCVGTNAFDLLDASGIAFVPSRKNEVFIREAGRDVLRDRSAPDGARGYGLTDRPVEYPHAKSFAPLFNKLQRLTPEQLVPQYFAEPSISTPKKPFGLGVQTQ